MKYNLGKDFKTRNWVINYDEFTDVLEFYDRNYYLIDRKLLIRDISNKERAVVTMMKENSLLIFVKIEDAYDKLGGDINSFSKKKVFEKVVNYLN